MNTFVRNKIIKDNLILFGIGIACIIGGFVINAVIYEIGYISILMVVPLIGTGLFFYSLFRVIYWPSNEIYKNWIFYGGNDKIIEEINEAINHKKKDLESSELIISNGWIIKPKEFIFVKPKDVNWIYLSQHGVEGSNIHNQKIKIHATFGLSFEVNCSQIQLANKNEGLTTEDVTIYLNNLNHYCKNAIMGYRPEFKLFWKNSPKNFIERVKKYADKHKGDKNE